MRRLGVAATSRASFAVHNTARTSTAWSTGLGKVQDIFA